jgi:hypothetical protein
VSDVVEARIFLEPLDTDDAGRGNQSVSWRISIDFVSEVWLKSTANPAA